MMFKVQLHYFVDAQSSEEALEKMDSVLWETKGQFYYDRVERHEPTPSEGAGSNG